MQSRVKYKKGRVTDKLLPMLKLMVVQVWKLLHKGETCLPCPAVFLHCELWTGCKKCLTLACFHDPVQPSLVTRIATSLCISSLYLVVKKKICSSFLMNLWKYRREKKCTCACSSTEVNKINKWSSVHCLGCRNLSHMAQYCWFLSLTKTKSKETFFFFLSRLQKHLTVLLQFLP